MQRIAALLLIAIMLGPLVTAQTGPTLEYSTEIRPAVLVFEHEIARDENGDPIRDEDGGFQLERQFVTLTVEARVPCAPEPAGDETFGIAMEGRRFHVRDAATKEIQATYLDLEPRVVVTPWRQESIGGDWVASASYQIEVISDAKPFETFESEYIWDIDPETSKLHDSGACRVDNIESSVGKHLIIVRGSDIPAGEEVEIPDDYANRGIPLPGPVVALAAIGMAAALRRRV